MVEIKLCCHQGINKWLPLTKQFLKKKLVRFFLAHHLNLWLNLLLNNKYSQRLLLAKQNLLHHPQWVNLLLAN